MEKKLLNLIDSHCHFSEMAKKEMNTQQIIDECFENGLEACLDIGIATNDIKERIKYKREGVYFAVALYPSFSEKDYIVEVEQLEKNIIDFRSEISVLGECGLDFYWNYADATRQLELLEMQIDLANRYNLPVAIHCREADSLLVDFLSRKKLNQASIIHCFSSDMVFAKKYIDLGFKLSFAGNLTYKKSIEIQEACRAISVKDILVETDSPYLSPQPIRGKLNSPGNIHYTYDFIAQLKGIPTTRLANQVKENFYEIVK
ncbi:MAG: TatD family hydrolase [Spirochaetales bacterium]|nr:TatD family hydrolase [Spirochaetales bacterium]